MRFSHFYLYHAFRENTLTFSLKLWTTYFLCTVCITHKPITSYTLHLIVPCIAFPPGQNEVWIEFPELSSSCLLGSYCAWILSSKKKYLVKCTGGVLLECCLESRAIFESTPVYLVICWMHVTNSGEFKKRHIYMHIATKWLFLPC